MSDEIQFATPNAVVLKDGDCPECRGHGLVGGYPTWEDPGGTEPDLCPDCNGSGKAPLTRLELLATFSKGMRVRYVPMHAKGNRDHADCENGVVSSVGKFSVFVKYDNAEMVMITGDEPYTAQGTEPQDLVKL